MQMTTHNSLHIRKGYFSEEYSYIHIYSRNLTRLCGEISTL